MESFATAGLDAAAGWGSTGRVDDDDVLPRGHAISEDATAIKIPRKPGLPMRRVDRRFITRIRSLAQAGARIDPRARTPRAHATFPRDA